MKIGEILPKVSEKTFDSFLDGIMKELKIPGESSADYRQSVLRRWKGEKFATDQPLPTIYGFRNWLVGQQEE